jgi:tRNA A37 methylthiotransferase MiaB
MRRQYTVQDFVDIVANFRRQIPELTLATDIICGFPGESEEAFDETLQIITTVKPDVVNISKFSPRPRTSARKLKQLPSQIVKERSKRASALCRKLSFDANTRWIGWIGDVLINEKGKDKTWIGRNYAYKPVVIQEHTATLGTNMRIRIEKAFPSYLLGKHIDS